MEKIKFEIYFDSPQSTDTRFCVIDEEVQEFLNDNGFKLLESDIDKGALCGTYVIDGDKEKLIEAFSDLKENGEDDYPGLYWEFCLEIDGQYIS